MADGLSMVGLELIFSRLKRLQTNARTADTAARKGARFMLAQIDKNYEAGGLPRWRRLAPSTVLRRGSSGPILQVTGAMRRAFGFITSGGGFRIFNRDPKFKWHELGTKRMPARRSMIYHAGDRRELGRTYSRHLWGK